jgi:hypothetical protein
MSVSELRQEIARCLAKEEQRGLAAKVRRSWKEAKEEAEVELQRRDSSDAN